MIFYDWCLQNNPKLLDEWDYELNDISPKDITHCSGQNVHWKCKLGHKWEMPLLKRTANKNNQCPFCNNRRLLTGYNDFETWCKKNDMLMLLSEYDEIKNGCSPSNMPLRKEEHYWWKCEKGHSWHARLNHRIRFGSGCPVCANLKLLKGYNDFETWCHKNNREDMLKEWDYEKNNFLPSEILYGTAKRIHWKCKYGHKWSINAHHRIHGSDCPTCFLTRRSSRIEKTYLFYCKKYFPDAIGNVKFDWLGRMELDIFIPSLKIGIEYDGQVFHKDSDDKEKKKYNLCKENEILLIRIKEKITKQENADKILYNFSYDDASVEKSIAELLQYLDIDNPVVNIKDDRKEISDLINKFSEEKTLYSWCIKNNRQDILDSWDYQSNNGLTPKNVFYGEHNKYYFICEEGHRYELSIQNRLSNKNCPYCCGRRVKKGYNDFETICKESGAEKLLKEWDYSKNDILPSEIYSNSNTKIFWKCKEGHQWSASPLNRLKNPICPVCKNKKLFKGMNDLETWCKCNKKDFILKQWDYDKNILKPSEVIYCSLKKYYWKCENGHVWISSVNSRCCSSYTISECPICSKDERIIGKKSFAAWCEENKKIHLITEYDNKKNEMSADEIPSSQYGKKVWWICDKGHSYQATLRARKNGQGCPYCSNHKVWSGFNDLETWCKNNNRQDVLDSWDYEKNKTPPNKVPHSSTNRCWWKCEKGHSWESSINSRTSSENCPICANKIVLSGFNDLETWCYNNSKEYLLKQWDYNKNTILPSQITYGVRKKVWWKCEKGHEWEADIANRRNGNGCPECNKSKTKEKINHIGNTHPFVASQWHPFKNKDLKPNYFTCYSKEKVWWLCPHCKHEWQQRIDHRIKILKCPNCSKQKE